MSLSFIVHGWILSGQAFVFWNFVFTLFPEGQQDVPGQDVPLWHKDPELQTLEKLWKRSTSSLFVREICIRKGSCTRKRASTRDTTSSSEKPVFMAAESFVHYTKRLLLFSCVPPLWSPGLLHLSLAQDSIEASVAWPPFGSPVFVGVLHVIKFIFLLTISLRSI